MTPPIAPTSELSEADKATRRASSYVRTVVVPVQETLHLPADPAARRRLMAQRRV
ncbi:hypothetical protein OG786_29275 [Streptomyces sp. NBC_00101]|uniref:hypothetical protein n=1 Tax=Streptomyces sp. NBC_00101 TaxID=2975651 RepID=UPI0032564995